MIYGTLGQNERLYRSPLAEALAVGGENIAKGIDSAGRGIATGVTNYGEQQAKDKATKAQAAKDEQTYQRALELELAKQGGASDEEKLRQAQLEAAQAQEQRLGEMKTRLDSGVDSALTRTLNTPMEPVDLTVPELGTSMKKTPSLGVEDIYTPKSDYEFNSDAAKGLIDVRNQVSSRQAELTPLVSTLSVPFTPMEQIGQNVRRTERQKLEAEQGKLTREDLKTQSERYNGLQKELRGTQLDPTVIDNYAKQVGADTRTVAGLETVLPWAQNQAKIRDDQAALDRARVASNQSLDKDTLKLNVGTYKDTADKNTKVFGWWQNMDQTLRGKTDAPSMQQKIDMVAKLVDEGAVEGSTRDLLAQKIGFNIWGVNPVEIGRRLTGKALDPEVSKVLDNALDQAAMAAARNQIELNARYNGKLPQGYVMTVVPPSLQKRIDNANKPPAARYVLPNGDIYEETAPGVFSKVK